MYNQLTLAQRYTISTMRQNGFSLKTIADELNRIEEEAAISSGNPLPEKKRSASTISRELKRSRTKTGRYNPKQADEMAREKRERIVRNTAIKPGVLELAIKLLKGKGWSPEQISGHLKKEGKRISKERIYQEIRRKPELSKYCYHYMKYRRHQAKPYKTAGKSMIPDRVSIHERPAEANGKRFGDWEMDLVIGAEQNSAVLTIICHRIKTDICFSHIPIILLTAKSADEHILSGLREGADEYITKPFNLDILFMRIQKLLDWTRANHERFKTIDLTPSEITVSTLDEELIQKAIRIVEENMDNSEFSVEDFSLQIGISRSGLYKKLMSITGKSPLKFIRIIRLKRGRQLLEGSQSSISQVAYQVGLSPKQFAKYFREQFGELPSDYINKRR